MLFPLADAAAAWSASRLASCTRTIRCTAKYVNTPESTLFHKSAVVYGLDKARAAIAREDRAFVVEGNTDVIALRQAGFGPSWRAWARRSPRRSCTELGRLTKRLWLAFDGDAAGEFGDAPRDGARRAAGVRRERRRAAGRRRSRRRPGGLRGAPRAQPSRTSSIASQAEIEPRRGPEAAFRIVKAILDERADSPEEPEAWRSATDRLGLTDSARARRLSSARPVRRRRGITRRRRAARAQRARRRRSPTEPASVLAELTAEHF